MKDRQSTYPGRVKLLPVAGQADTFDMTMADAPTEPGTPPIKQNLMPDALATALGLNPATATVAEGIWAAAERAKVKVGSIVSSVRDDFKAEVTAGVYVQCSGQIIAPTSYPQLSPYLTFAAGSSWVQASPTQSSYFSSFYDAGNGRVFGGGYNTGVWYSDNNGATWTQSNWKELEVTCFVRTNTGRLIAGTSSSSLIQSDDNGVNWTLIARPPQNVDALYKTQTGRILAGGNAGVFYSDNNGDNWTTAVSGGKVRGFVLSSAGSLFCIRDEYGIYKSTDNGASWQASKSVGGSRWSLAVTSTGRLVCGENSNSLYVSDDDGATWVTISVGVIMYKMVASGARVVAGTSNGVQISDNNCQTWSTVSGVSSGRVRALALTATGRLLMGDLVDYQWVRYSDTSAKLPNIPNFYVKVKES